MLICHLTFHSTHCHETSLSNPWWMVSYSHTFLTILPQCLCYAQNQIRHPKIELQSVVHAHWMVSKWRERSLVTRIMKSTVKWTGIIVDISQTFFAWFLLDFYAKAIIKSQFGDYGTILWSHNPSIYSCFRSCIMSFHNFVHIKFNTRKI